MSKHHEDLLKRFFERTATPEEQDELYRILTGTDAAHKDELINPMIELIKEKKQIPPTEELAMQEIFNLMIAGNENMTRLEGNEPLRKTSWLKYAAAAMITLAMGFALYYYGYRVPLEQAGQQTAVNGNALETQRTVSGKKYIPLPDGSKVTLNEGSVLTYDESLGNDTRNVFLSGEAYFDIQHDAARPFIVHTGKFTTTVLGTEFNVRAYENDHKITVTVKKGKVKVGDDENNQYGTITPNEQIALNTATHDFIKAEVNAEAEISWKSEFVILDAATLEEAAKIIEAKYKVKISLANDKLKNCRITSTFLNDEKLDDGLAVVTTAVNATYTMKGTDVVISGEGKGCN